MDPGTGKTAIPLWYLWRNKKERLLIICPAYLIPNWVREIPKVLGTEKPPRVAVFDAGKKIYRLWEENIVITSYDLALKAEFLFEEWATMVVFDEAHNLASMKAKRTEFIHRVIFENSIPRVAMLTGTPIKNRVEEFYSLMALCHYDPSLETADGSPAAFLKRFPSSIDFADHFSFRREFEMQVGERWIAVSRWEGLRRQVELKEWLKGKYFRVTDKVLGLGETTFVDTLVSETPDHALLAEFERYFETSEFGDSTKVQAKADAAMRTVPFTVQYVTDLLHSTDCVVVFSDHIGPCEAIAEAFGVPAITGQMSPKNRMAAVQRFMAGGFKVLSATVRSLSEGHDLTRAHHLVFNDPSWVPGSVNQAIYRIKRISQTRPPVVHRVFGSPQSQKIWDRVSEKAKVIQAVT